MKNYIGREGVLKSTASPLLLDIQQLTLWKKRERKAVPAPDLRIGFVSEKRRSQGSAGIVEISCGKVSALPETIEKIADQSVEIAVLFPQVLDLTDRVNNGRVMLPAEAPADFWKRRMRQRLAEVHRDLARHGDRLRVVS